MSAFSWRKSSIWIAEGCGCWVEFLEEHCKVFDIVSVAADVGGDEDCFVRKGRWLVAGGCTTE
jgi:hypothetical protein